MIDALSEVTASVVMVPIRRERRWFIGIVDREPQHHSYGGWCIPGQLCRHVNLRCDVLHQCLTCVLVGQGMEEEVCMPKCLGPQAGSCMMVASLTETRQVVCPLKGVANHFASWFIPPMHCRHCGIRLAGWRWYLCVHARKRKQLHCFILRAHRGNQFCWWACVCHSLFVCKCVAVCVCARSLLFRGCTSCPFFVVADSARNPLLLQMDLEASSLQTLKVTPVSLQSSTGYS